MLASYRITKKCELEICNNQQVHSNLTKILLSCSNSNDSFVLFQNYSLLERVTKDVDLEIVFPTIFNTNTIKLINLLHQINCLTECKLEVLSKFTGFLTNLIKIEKIFINEIGELIGTNLLFIYPKNIDLTTSEQVFNIKLSKLHKLYFESISLCEPPECLQTSVLKIVMNHVEILEYFLNIPLVSSSNESSLVTQNGKIYGLTSMKFWSLYHFLQDFLLVKEISGANLNDFGNDILHQLYNRDGKI